ncbi:MAG: hypothetical protein AAF922_10760 [Pseudomonadota bacterium]
MGGARTAMIALDAADLSLLHHCVEMGHMPVFGELLKRGCSGKLSSLGRWLPGSVWPSFYTSSAPSQTGFHHYLQWSSQEMALRRPEPLSIGTPFWRCLTNEGAQVIAIDMPFASAPSAGIELTGWATLDSLEPPCAHPLELLSEIQTRLGPSPRVDEMHALQTFQALRQLRDEQIQIAGMLAELSEFLLARETADLFLLTFPGLHRGGHWLWDESGLLAAPPSSERKELEAALPAVYAATDQALGRVLDAADADEIILFSLHGMGPNTSRVEILDDMLSLVLADGGQVTRPLKLWEQMRKALPPTLRHAVKTNLPTKLQDRLTGFWRTGGRNWKTTPALTQVADLTGYIRLNISGREADGALSKDDVLELCERVSEGFATFVDADSGEPVVQRVARIDEVVQEGPRRELLPDLMVDWSDIPAARHRSIVSDTFGSIDWPTPGRHPSGRSGNHRAEGFYLAFGAGLPQGDGPSGSILDLAPTVLSRLGITVPEQFQGAPLLGGSDDNRDPA